eukprot:gene7702-7901_t
MEAHCSQLTSYGLLQLSDKLKEHQLAVFFRNNHFNTLFKYEGSVYLLVTDQGYECESDIVWERLDSVNGNTTLCSSDFGPFVPHADPTRGAAGRRLNRVRVVACCCWYWALFTVLFAFCNSTAVGTLLWAFNGIGLGLMIPNAQSLVADYYDAAHRGKAFGMLLAV